MKNSKNVLVAFLAALVVLLAVGLILSLNGTLKLKNDTSIKESITYESLEGLYGGTINDTDYNIYLYKNGTFSYNKDESIYIGNYQIKDNNITLNFWMYLASQYHDFSDIVDVNGKSSVVTINADNTLGFTKQSDNIIDNNVTLKKITGEKEKTLLASKSFDIKHLIKNTIESLTE